MRLLLLTSVFTVALLTGCSSPASEIRYYQLANLPPENALDGTVKPLAIAPIKVADYLNGSGLVLQQTEVELSIARQHLWADALALQLQRQLTEQILLVLPTQQLVPLNTPGALTLQLEVDRFHATADGFALVSGRFNLLTGGRYNTIPFSQRVALTEDGYPAMVRALSLGWQQALQQLMVVITTPATSDVP